MAISRARRERRKAQRHLKTGTPAQKAKAKITIAATTPILEAEKATRGKGLEELRGMRETRMGDREAAVGSAAKIEEANIARAYADAMRMLTGREKAEGTRYTGPGVQGLVGDQPAIDPGAYTKRYMDPTTTEFQDINLQRMLALEGTIPERREEFRAMWGDPGSDDYARMQEWQRQQLLAGGAPTPVWTGGGAGGAGGGGGGSLGRGVAGSAFQHPYAADPYKVPHMETGGLWEGLGAEYQPGTVEGLGLLAGRAYAPYEPLRQGLLNARPDFMGTPSGFTPMNFEGGLEGSTDTTNTTTTTTSTDDQTAAMNRLYAAANKAGNWGNVTFGSYPAGQQSWFYGPRGGDMSYTYGGDPYSYTQIMAGEHIK